MVNIFVGAEQKRYHLHRDLLCHRSDYFRACFVGEFKEAQENELSLPEDDIESFDLFVKWLYGATLKKISSNTDLPVYLNLYVLADKLCLEHLQNETMDLILRFYRTTPYQVDIEILQQIPQDFAGCGIHIFLLTLAGWSTASNNHDINPDYLSLIWEGGDLAEAFTKCLSWYYRKTKGDPVRIAKCDPRAKSNCHYHEHQSTPVCEDPSE